MFNKITDIPLFGNAQKINKLIYLYLFGGIIL
jgi:hypothetical protein